MDPEWVIDEAIERAPSLTGGAILVQRNRLVPTVLEAYGGTLCPDGQRQRESGQVAASLAHDIGDVGLR